MVPVVKMPAVGVPGVEVPRMKVTVLPMVTVVGRLGSRMSRRVTAIGRPAG